MVKKIDIVKYPARAIQIQVEWHPRDVQAIAEAILDAVIQESDNDDVLRHLDRGADILLNPMSADDVKMLVDGAFDHILSPWLKGASRRLVEGSFEEIEEESVFRSIGGARFAAGVEELILSSPVTVNASAKAAKQEERKLRDLAKRLTEAGYTVTPPTKVEATSAAKPARKVRKAK